MRHNSSKCHGKVAYPSYAAAAAHRRRAGLVELEIYSCGNHFHLGHRRGRQYASRGTHFGGSRYQRVLDAIEAAVRS